MSDVSSDKIEVTFEEAYRQLESAVKALETGGSDNLEESLTNYEKGVKCLRICRKKLNDAIRRIDALKDEDNEERIGLSSLNETVLQSDSNIAGRQSTTARPKIEVTIVTEVTSNSKDSADHRIVEDNPSSLVEEKQENFSSGVVRNIDFNNEADSIVEDNVSLPEMGAHIPVTKDDGITASSVSTQSVLLCPLKKTDNESIDNDSNTLEMIEFPSGDNEIVDSVSDVININQCSNTEERFPVPIPDSQKELLVNSSNADIVEKKQVRREAGKKQRSKDRTKKSELSKNKISVDIESMDNLRDSNQSFFDFEEPRF